MKNSLFSLKLLIALCCLCLFSVTILNGQQAAHQGIFYIDDNCTNVNCVEGVAIINEHLASLQACGVNVNILLCTQDCNIELLGSILIGPEYNGNPYWHDANVDYTLILQPGSQRVIASSGESSVILDDVYAFAGSSLTYAMEYYCMIEVALLKIKDLNDCNFNTPNSICDASKVVITSGNVLLHTGIDEVVNPNETEINELLDSIESNFCSKVITYVPWYITSFSEDIADFKTTQFINFPNSPLCDSLRSLYGNDFVLFFIIPINAEQKFEFNIIYITSNSTGSEFCFPHSKLLGINNKETILEGIGNVCFTYQLSEVGIGLKEGLRQIERILKANDGEKPDQTVCNIPPLEDIPFVETPSYEFSTIAEPYMGLSSISRSVLLGGELETPVTTSYYRDYAGLGSDFRDSLEISGALVNTSLYYNTKTLTFITSDQNQATFTTPGGVVIPPNYQTIVDTFNNWDMSELGAEDALIHMHVDRGEGKIYLRFRYKENSISFDVDIDEVYPQHAGYELSNEDKFNIANARDKAVETAGKLSMSQCNSPVINEEEYTYYGMKGKHSLPKRINTCISAVREVVKQVKTPVKMWAADDTDNPDYEDGYLLRCPPFIAGTGDAFIEESVTAIPELILFSASMFTNKEERKQTFEALKHPWRLMNAMRKDILDEPLKDVKEHKISKAGVNVIFLFVKGPASITSVLKNLPKKARGVAKEFDDILAKISKDSNKEAFAAKFDNVGVDFQTEFFEFFGKNQNNAVKQLILEKFVKKPELVDLWGKVKTGGLTEEFVQKLHAAFDKFPVVGSNSSIFYEKLFAADGLNALNINVDNLKTFLTDVADAPQGFVDALNSAGRFKAWKRMLDANVPASMRNNVDALEYVGSPRTNKIKLDVEEALGGHSVARHGSGIPIVEMEQRVLGTHPNLNQSRSALKFDDDVIHQNSVDQAFNHYKAEIKAHFDAGGGYKTWGPFEIGNRVGEGYHNYSTLSNPTATHVTSSKVNIAFRPDPDHPDGFMLDSAYPKFVP